MIKTTQKRNVRGSDIAATAGASFVFTWMAAVFIAGAMLVIGWILNVFDVIRIIGNGAEWTAMDVLHLVGIIVFPLGGVMGWT